MGIYKAKYRLVFKHDYGGITLERSEKRSFISPTKPPLNIIKWRPKPKSYIPILLVPPLVIKRETKNKLGHVVFSFVRDY